MQSDIDLYKNDKKFTLFNIRTGEILNLDMSNIEDLHDIMLALIRGKYTQQPVKTTEEFLHDCHAAAAVTTVSEK